MTRQPTRRLAVVLAATGLALVALWSLLKPYLFDAPPGDYEVRQGDILLTDGKYDAAIERFDAALAVSPDHRGALMGKGIAYLQSERPAQAEAVFTHLIDMLPADARGGRCHWPRGAVGCIRQPRHSA